MTKTLDDLLRNVVEGQATALTVAKEVLDLGDGDKADSVSLVVEQRVLQPEPPQQWQRIESPGRGHVFHDVEGFVAYLQKYRTDDTLVLANAESCEVEAILNEASDDGFEIVTLVPLIHPVLEPWHTVIGKTMPVLDFATHCMTHRRCISTYEGRAGGADPQAGKELAFMLSQVTADSVMTLNRGQGARSINGIVVETKIQGELRSEPVDIPDSITVLCPIFIGTPSVPIEFDLLVTKRKDDIVVHVTSSTMLQSKCDVFHEMIGAMASLDAVVAMGYVRHSEWRYLEYEAG